MRLDLQGFYQACNPSPLVLGNAEDRKYYIDFSLVRGANLVQELGRTITRLSPDKPTCQLFTGHIGCGKSTELQLLKTRLEEQGFHVVYFESSRVLEMADVDVTDILLSITRQVSESLEAVERTPPKSKIMGGDSCAKKRLSFSTFPELLASSVCRQDFCCRTL